MRGNIISNKQNNKRRLSMSRRDEVNRERFPASIDEPHEELGHGKGSSFFWPQKTPLLI